MQPSGSAIESIKLFKGEAVSVQVNLPSFWKNKKETQIPVDQIFFYDYFKRKNESERKSKKKEQVDGDGDNEEADEDEESDEQGGATSEKGSENEEDEDIDLEETEIWKVGSVSFLGFLKSYKHTLGDESDDASRGTRSPFRQL